MSRYIKRNNAVLLIVEFEIYRVVTLVAIEDKEAISLNSSRLRILIKVFNLL
jgi:hypothetical protein